MKIQLPEKVTYILNTLKEHGYQGYAVGGCVRDSLLGRTPQDWDITTNAKPMEVKSLFRRTIDTGIQHGTVTVMLEKEGFEVTTYRIDGIYEDGRHPKNVEFTPNLVEDLKRRDFTINAMAYNEEEGLVDEFCGIQDLKRKMIRCVGKPQERFAEDALRMLRALRFGAQLGFDVEPETMKAVMERAATIEKISAERIQTELMKLLLSKNPQHVKKIYETGLSRYFLPELDTMMETRQNNPHHCYTVGEHTLHVLCEVPPRRVIRLAALFHDVAKPVCITTDEKGIQHFHGHPEKGAELTRQILRRLKFDNDTISGVCKLVAWHDDNPPLTEKNIRRAMNRIGVEQYPDILLLKHADVLAQSQYQQTEKLEYLKQYTALYEKIIKEQQCITMKQLAVTGSDLIAEGMTPGKELGEELKRLLELVLDDPKLNNRQQLLKQINKPKN